MFNWNKGIARTAKVVFHRKLTSQWDRYAAADQQTRLVTSRDDGRTRVNCCLYITASFGHGPRILVTGIVLSHRGSQLLVSISVLTHE